MSYFQKTMSFASIFYVLILASSLPYSWSRPIEQNKDANNCILDLCNDNYRPQQCEKIINDNQDGFGGDDTKAAYTAIDLARGKASEVFDLFTQLLSNSDDNDLKDKYQTCATNYSDAIRDINQARSSLDSNEAISDQLHAALDDFEECRHKFAKGENDPANILERNHEFFVYAQLARDAGEKLDHVRN